MHVSFSSYSEFQLIGMETGLHGFNTPFLCFSFSAMLAAARPRWPALGAAAPVRAPSHTPGARRRWGARLCAAVPLSLAKAPKVRRRVEARGGWRDCQESLWCSYTWGQLWRKWLALRLALLLEPCSVRHNLTFLWGAHASDPRPGAAAVGADAASGPDWGCGSWSRIFPWESR